MMCAIVFPGPRISDSFGAGPACFLAHTGSASMAIGLSVGAFPAKVTVPVMVDAATATPGEPSIATSTAAGHTLLFVPPMLGFLVIVHVSFVVAEGCVPRDRSAQSA